jgi:hypothetical protein
MSYRIPYSTGAVRYRQTMPRASAKVSARMPDISNVLSEESEPRSRQPETARGYRCKSSTHLYLFFHYPKSRRLVVEFQNGERYMYENVSRTLFDGLIREDEKKSGSAGIYFYRYISGDPEKHPFKKLN